VSFFVFISEQWILVSALLVLIYVFAFSEQKKAGKQLSVHELTRLLNGDEAVLIDLRDSKEYAAGCITGAINIPSAKLDGRISELESWLTRLASNLPLPGANYARRATMCSACVVAWVSGCIRAYPWSIRERLA